MNRLKLKFNYLGKKIKETFSNSTRLNTIRRQQTYEAGKMNYKFLFIYPIFYIPQIAYLDDEEKHSRELENKDIIRGEYENKIRSFASIEKRFLVFSKAKKYGDYRMTYYQFLDSIIPFQYIKTIPNEELIKFLSENEKFAKAVKKFDINGDGYINFEEYIILCIFLSANIQDFIIQFPSGKATREQLAEYIMNVITSMKSLKITNRSSIDGRIIKTDYNTLYKYLVDFLSANFKDKVLLDIKMDICRFQYELYSLLIFYEFYSIPQVKKDTISIENFAKVWLSYANIYKNKQYKKKIEENLIDLSGEVTFDQFISFFWFVGLLSVHRYDMFRKGKLDLADLRKFANEKLKAMPNMDFEYKKGISDRQLKVFIDLFDMNGDGQLEYTELEDILKRRYFYSNSISDFKKESKSFLDFFKSGFLFIRNNLWFIK